MPWNEEEERINEWISLKYCIYWWLLLFKEGCEIRCTGSVSKKYWIKSRSQNLCAKVLKKLKKRHVKKFIFGNRDAAFWFQDFELIMVFVALEL